MTEAEWGASGVTCEAVAASLPRAYPDAGRVEPACRVSLKANFQLRAHHDHRGEAQRSGLLFGNVPLAQPGEQIYQSSLIQPIESTATPVSSTSARRESREQRLALRPILQSACCVEMAECADFDDAAAPLLRLATGMFDRAIGIVRACDHERGKAKLV